ncbi:hypothetical protein FisN_3Lh316 [Fistulifera solaris]|uniref:Glutathione S-transferase n=1 Tax=Fistulifera solaris TaxID=1519565 RepID=A0A1Z5J802_FISSO|nr:hypothetical protein FisN_3Lh316 [Fistulifera solaris]|eukprot:GAX10124.1 hypothetical protein FisN_3Lh316 [Fistulifera solaris]
MTERRHFFQLFLFLSIVLPIASGWQIQFVARPFTALSVSNRGLEVRQEGATPTEGGMILYCKAGPDGQAIGDCPFCHFVRLVLEELNLEYEVLPTTSETKPKWLVDHYEGKMPALRHRKECYTESSVIVDYLLFFFGKNKEISQTSSNDIVGGLFPAVAKYLKHTPDNDDTDLELRDNLKIILQQLDDHLVGKQFWNGDIFTQVDCKLAPQLYHLQCGIDAFQKQIDLAEYDHLTLYMSNLFARPSFQATVYPKETVEWGWSNARN